MTLPYFPDKIHKGEVEPSINEMGDSFAYVLKIQEMLFGQRKTSLPFLYSDVIKGDIERIFIDPQKVVKTVEKYKSRDYSMFYRGLHHLGGVGVQLYGKDKQCRPEYLLQVCTVPGCCSIV